MTTSDAEDSDGGSLDEEAKTLLASAFPFHCGPQMVSLSPAEARAPHLQDIDPPNPSAASSGT